MLTKTAASDCVPTIHLEAVYSALYSCNMRNQIIWFSIRLSNLFLTLLLFAAAAHSCSLLNSRWCWARRCLRQSKVFVPFEGARGISPLFPNTVATESRFVLFLAAALPWCISFPLRTGATHQSGCRKHSIAKKPPVVQRRLSGKRKSDGQ